MIYNIYYTTIDKLRLQVIIWFLQILCKNTSCQKLPVKIGYQKY